MRLSRTRSIALATAAAVTAAGVVAPSALAQEETAPDAETAAVSESAAPESESETPAADESESESAPEDEPETEAPATAAKVSIEIKADKTKQSISHNLEENDEVAAALAGHANVGWKHEGDSLPLGMKFSPVTATVTVNPNTLRDKTPQTFVATDLDTGEVVAEVTVNVTGVADTPINPGDDIKKTTPQQVAIIVGVAAAIAATLAGMVQFLVPGGWQHVISYFSGQR